MGLRKDILLAIRRLRNDIMAGKRGANSAKEKLRYQCEQIQSLPLPGQDWSSWEMPDPLFPQEQGHSVRIVSSRRDSGWVVSLTGKKIIGRVSHASDSEKVASQLTTLTGAGKWKKKSGKR